MEERRVRGEGPHRSFAPPRTWPAIQRTFEVWVAAQGLGLVVVCRPIPREPHLITFEPGSPDIVQLDVKVRGTFRGSTLIDARDLRQLCEIDPLGFRRVRPGAEGVIKLCLNGTRERGRPDHDALPANRVAEPGVAASRIWFLEWAAKRCPVVTLIHDQDRRLPGDRDRWLDEVGRDHEVTQVG